LVLTNNFARQHIGLPSQSNTKAPREAHFNNSLTTRFTDFVKSDRDVAAVYDRRMIPQNLEYFQSRRGRFRNSLGSSTVSVALVGVSPTSLLLRL
jgi:hypothetical protein